MPNLFFFFKSGILEFCKLGTGDLFPIKRREKPNLYRRKRTSDGDVIGDQSWVIGGQRHKVEDDSNVMSFGVPRNLCIYFRINFLINMLPK